MAEASSSSVSLIIPNELSKYQNKENIQIELERKIDIVENKMWNKSHKLKLGIEIQMRLRDSNVPLVEHRRGLGFQCPGVNCTFTCLEGMSLAKIYAESELQIGNWLLSHEVHPEKKGCACGKKLYLVVRASRSKKRPEAAHLVWRFSSCKTHVGVKNGWWLGIRLPFKDAMIFF